MPRQLLRAANHDRNRSLGWLATAWMEALTVHGPGDVQGMPVVMGDEVAGLVIDCYAVDRRAGRRLYDSVFYSRPKGSDKSGLGGRFCLFEGLGPARFAGWAKGGEVYRDPWGLGFEYVYQPGEPMGRRVNVPYIRCMATEELQTGNVYDTCHFNLTEGPLAEAMRRTDDAGLTRILLPGGGEITPSTSSSAAKDGGKETFVDFDESHLYNTPELRRMYNTVTRNLRKRKKIAETWYLETTTMFAPGEESVAEETYELARAIREKKTTRPQRLLLDHRWGDIAPEDLDQVKLLRAALTDAYGEAIEWNDLEGLVNEFFDPRKAVADSRRYFLNAPTSTADAWLSQPEWVGCLDETNKVVDKRDAIVIGFDGSRSRKRGVTDATALVGCRVSDGHMWLIEAWEEPDTPAARKGDWEVPAAEVDAAVRTAFASYNVVGMYADPSKWESYVASWEAKYLRRLKVKASRDHPMSWWINAGRGAAVQKAIDALHDSIVDREMTHDGGSILTRHFLNARNRKGPYGMWIGKEHPASPKKIDAAWAGVAAWAARVDALAAGLDKVKKTATPSRIR